jgi:hypothetical protein
MDKNETTVRLLEAALRGNRGRILNERQVEQAFSLADRVFEAQSVNKKTHTTKKNPDTETPQYPATRFY